MPRHKQVGALPAPSPCIRSSGSVTHGLRHRQEHATQSGLFKAEWLLDHSDRMLHLGAEVRFDGLDQAIYSPLGTSSIHSSSTVDGRDRPADAVHGNRKS